MHNRSRAALFAALLAVLAVPASASAATKSVDMGTSGTLGKSFQKLGVDVDNFFPQKTTIHVGDSVVFKPVGFHTVDLPKRGGKTLALIAPNGLVAGANDAGGNPFWFNGQAKLGFNPALLKFGFGKKLTYNGSKEISSGLPVANKPKPMTVKFARAGTFTYYCTIHPGMKGTVRVVAKSRPVPSAKADTATLKQQIKADLSTAKSIVSKKPAAGTVSVGQSGKGGVEYLGFLPQTQTVPVGTTLKFAMPTGSREEHTATFGPGNPEQDPKSYLGTLAASLQSPAFDPAALYPSDPPGTVPTLTSSSHGNGFFSTGFIDATSATKLPASGTVTFGQAGTYEFYCLIHPFMHGTITVK